MKALKEMSDDELAAVDREMRTAYLYAYLESIRNDVPAMLALATEIEKAIAAAREQQQENRDAEAWARGDPPTQQ